MKRALTVILSLLVVFGAFVIGAEVPTQAATVKLSKKSVKLEVGKTKKIKVKGTKETVTWSTSDKKVATVSKKGKITAKGVGECTITAKAGSKTLTCKVTVTAPASLNDSHSTIDKAIEEKLKTVKEEDKDIYKQAYEKIAKYIKIVNKNDGYSTRAMVDSIIENTNYLAQLRSGFYGITGHETDLECCFIQIFTEYCNEIINENKDFYLVYTKNEEVLKAGKLKEYSYYYDLNKKYEDSLYAEDMFLFNLATYYDYFIGTDIKDVTINNISYNEDEYYIIHDHELKYVFETTVKSGEYEKRVDFIFDEDMNLLNIAMSDEDYEFYINTIVPESKL